MLLFYKKKIIILSINVFFFLFSSSSSSSTYFAFLSLFVYIITRNLTDIIQFLFTRFFRYAFNICVYWCKPVVVVWFIFSMDIDWSYWMMYTIAPLFLHLYLSLALSLALCVCAISTIKGFSIQPYCPTNYHYSFRFFSSSVFHHHQWLTLVNGRFFQSIWSWWWWQWCRGFNAPKMVK